MVGGKTRRRQQFVGRQHPVGAKTVHSPLPSVASRPVASSAEARIEKFVAGGDPRMVAADVVLRYPVVCAVVVVVPVDVTLPVEVTGWWRSSQPWPSP